MEDGFGLTSEPRLLTVVATSALRSWGFLAFLVLRDLVNSVLLEFGTVRPDLLGDLHHFPPIIEASMSDPFSAFKAVQICPGISLLDLLQIERLQPMRRQAVLPFFQSLCQRKKFLLIDATSVKAWPEQMIDQEAIFLLLEEWSLFLPLKLNTSLMFGEVTAVLAIAQPTDIKAQLAAFTQ